MENDHEDGPNFSYAFGQTSEESSWNPALRPNSTTGAKLPPSKPAFASPPPAVQEVESLQYPSDNQEVESHTDPDSRSRDSIGIFGDEPADDEDFFSQPHTQNGAESNMSEAPASGINGFEDTGAPEDSRTEVEEHESFGGINGTSNYSQNGDIHGEEDTEPTSEAHAPAENYEHQGETTFLEDAIAENEKAPLVSDKTPGADDWGTSAEAFDLGRAPLDSPMPTGQVESVVATAGDQSVQNIGTEAAPSQDIDWGTSDDQDLFGISNTQEGGTESTSLQHDAQVEQIGDAMWDLALDDDFLPDNDEGNAPFQLDDDDGFLEDEPSQSSQAVPTTANKYAPQTAQTPAANPPLNPYSLQGPQFTDLSKMDQKSPVGNVAYGAYNQPSPAQQLSDRPGMPSASQSFVDKSKGGYHSPFDLPEDIIASRKRPVVHHTVTAPAQHVPAPPPRSSSMYTDPNAGLVRPPPPPMAMSGMTPPSSSHSMKSPLSGQPTLSKPASTEFFAELPVTTKPKPPPSGRYTPQNNPPSAPPAAAYAPPQGPPKERTSSCSSLRHEVLPDTAGLITQLQQPERLPAFPDAPPPPARANTLPLPQSHSGSAPSRYSPAPPSGLAPPAANARYSPAPPTAPPAPAANQRYSPAPPQANSHNRYASEPPVGPGRPPFAPRTSSPLAYHTVSQEQQETPSATTEPGAPSQGHQMMQSVDGVPRVPFRRPLEEVSEVEEQNHVMDSSHAPQGADSPIPGRSETPPLRSSPSSVVGSPRKRSNYTPQYQPGPPPTASNIAPPKRSQSQSPGATMKLPVRQISSMESPASAHTPYSPPSNLGLQNHVPDVANVIPHRRQASMEFDYIVPNDERASDPLQRWKGYPIFRWGVGGAVITSFPKQIPRFGGGATQPMMKCSPGEVKIQSLKDTLPLADEIVKFPGPLKSKSKKKEVSAWLGRKIEALENDIKLPGLENSIGAQGLTLLEEKILLWKIMQILIDNDGQLENNPAAEAAVRKVLSPDAVDSGEPSASFTTAADLIIGSATNASSVQAEPVDPRAVQELRTLLTKGDREKAVWHAVDQRLWAHAMLLSSTLSKDIWKQVVQEFVRKEVKKMGNNNQALAVLYEIFAGNWEECIDELVPASARAGFQMVSTGGNETTQNAFQGLDKWRETLSLVLNNRSENDVQALLSLGRLLAGYGRVEAAHICFIFARSAAYFGGVDDPQSDIVLVGTDHRGAPLNVGANLESILLTEVYEFALSLSAPSGSYVMPHLQNYKLVHAYALAEYGSKSGAQQYCDSIAAAMKATTKISPYYNVVFVRSLDDLTNRLSQTPKDGSSSWISKPSMDKVSSSLLSKFNSFIAGDDDETASNHSGNADVGPFAKIAGNTPTMSPVQSNTDLYGTLAGYGAAPAPLSANSRYAPSGQYAPRTSLDQGKPRFEPPGRSSMESADGSAPRHSSDGYLPSPQMSGPYTPTQFSPPLQRSSASKAQTYAPLRSEPYSPVGSYGGPYQPTPPTEASPSFGYQPPQNNFNEQQKSPPSPPGDTSGGYEPPSMGYEPPTSSYEPPTSSYEPPTYEPYNPDESSESPVEEKKKKLTLDDDDDDDLAARAAALKRQQKSEADRIAEENFRKAAEADAKKAQEQKKSGGGGWLSGWFKKDAAASPGPIKAKLGEENSFYYDPELKKWVNKKAGADAATPSAPTPPPPRSGPPSRNVSSQSTASMPPLASSLPSNAAQSMPAFRNGPTSNPQRSSSMPPPMSGPPGPPSRASTPGGGSDAEGKMAPPLMRPSLSTSGGPPSRPGTGMSNASSIDDLLGAPQARKGPSASKKGKRGGRYVDVMAQK